MATHPERHSEHGTERRAGNHYTRLTIMIVLSFIAMYFLMYAMVDSAGNVYANANQVYMAALMTAAMVIIELLLMKDMYQSNVRNAIILGAAAVALILSWGFIRRQTGISDGQFLRSMIPHHASAILMCQEASIRDPEIVRLCQGIVSGQQAEIDQMKAKLGGRSSPPAREDSASVTAVVQRYHRALAAGDTAAAMSLLGEDAMILESGEIETRAQYRSQHLPADMEFARAVPSTREPPLVFAQRDFAWAVSASRAQGAFRGRPVDSQGAELMVLSRENEGWKIRAIHWSSR